MDNYKALLLIICFATNGSSLREVAEHWTGRWFPDKVTQAPEDARIPMGIYNPDCDDAQKSLAVDWLDDSTVFSCYNDRSEFIPNMGTRPLYEIQNVPPLYKGAHMCMNETITYEEIIPTFGSHRPLWPVWGEYEYVPPQRWIHNLEHGGVVMLYHPCANHREVDKLRSLVTRCLYRHVITPYSRLTPQRPLALVTWGSRLQMSAVSKKVVINFIKESAFHGPEHTARDGQYKHGLIRHAKVVSSQTDDIICPYV